MSSTTMRFPPEISRIFRVVVFFCLGGNIMYYFADFNRPAIGYYIAVKILISFTAIISYLNDRNKMLVISNRGLLIHDIEPSGEGAKLSFVFIIVAIIYNPIVGLFHSRDIWVIADVLTITFFLYKTQRSKEK